MGDGVVRRLGKVGPRRRERHEARVDAGGRDVLGQLDVGRAGLLEAGGPERRAHRLRDGVGSADPRRPLGDRLEHPRDVDELVRLLVQLVRAGLPGDGDHRRPVEERVRDARHEVGRARAERRHRDGGPPREPAVDVGHERRTLLVTGRDVTHAVVVRQRVEDVHRLLAGDGEDPLAALGGEAVDEQAGGGPGGGSGHAWQSTGRILGG